MTEEQSRAIQQLREDGYIVVVATPAEVDCLHRSSTETRLQEVVQNMLKSWQPKLDIEHGQEKLVVLNAQLAFAIPVGESLDAVYDAANMMLIPHQRHEVEGENSSLIDYTFDGEPRVSATKVEEWTPDEGFQ